MEAKEHKIRIPAHPSIYDPKPREIDVFFREPEGGINEETGLMLFIQGFGGHAESNVYKKMRKMFANKDNLVIIQCNYFGNEFMQDSAKINLQIEKIFNNKEIEDLYISGKVDLCKLALLCKNYNIQLEYEELMQESLSNFNDMGIMQALDCLTAVYAVIAILKENKCTFNSERIMAYGHSHGAYLAYLCNAYCPGLISLIIDNSAWILPSYLLSDRITRYAIGNQESHGAIVRFKYLARKINIDKEVRNLNYLYGLFKNRAEIICYHGTEDNLISCEEKRIFISKVKKAHFVEVSESMIDGKAFKSAGHGLEADFIELLNYSFANFQCDFEKKKIVPKDITIKTRRAEYHFSYSLGIPMLKVSGNI